MRKTFSRHALIASAVKSNHKIWSQTEPERIEDSEYGMTCCRDSAHLGLLHPAQRGSRWSVPMGVVSSPFSELYVQRP